jgi:Uma2 family endonuclease
MQLELDRPVSPPRRRFDVAYHHRMAETGILAPEDRVELIDGEIVEMAPIGSAHGGTTDCLTSLVARAVAEGRVQLRVQGPLRLDPFNEPQPDLLLLRPRRLLPHEPPHRRRRAAPGRDRRHLSHLRPRP